MSEATARHGLPLIQPGQAQKELAHNEALAMLDLLVQPAVVAVGVDTPPVAPAPGQCWVVGASPTGAWAGHAHALAGWTGAGWRFVAPLPGMAVWTGGAAGFARWDGTAWVVGARAAAIADPAGGATVDAEVRAVVGHMLAALRQHGLIAS